MRLVLVAIALFFVSAASLVAAAVAIGRIEDRFYRDAAEQVAQVESFLRLYPPKLASMPTAPAVLSLRKLRSGGQVTERVCRAGDARYRTLFPDLGERCGEWELARSVVRNALLSVAVTAVVLAIVLMGRIAASRYTGEVWSRNWTVWFLARGILMPLFLQTAVSLIAPGLALRAMTGRVDYAIALSVAGFVPLYWVQKRTVAVYLNAGALRSRRLR